MKLVFLCLFIATGIVCCAQQPDAQALHETAKGFVKQGDYPNAILVLKRALEQDPEDIEISKDLAFAQYLQRDYVNAMATIKPVLDKKDADVQAFQIGAMILKAREQGADIEKLYKRALKKFPKSGTLYNEYGELLWYKRDLNAIRQWEKGIEVDPNHSGNYYNAAKYYYFTMDKVWSIIYAEIFVNMESYSRRTIEIKNLLLNSFKKLFIDADMTKNQNNKNEFVAAYLNVMNRETAVSQLGITPESLTMIRTRFILDWDDKYASRFPFRLFEYHRQLLQEGLFDAYNQWLFGPVQNLTAFQNWTNAHAEVYKDFNNFYRGRVFKLPAGQNYQSK